MLGKGLVHALATLDHLHRLPIIMSPEHLQLRLSMACRKITRRYRVCSAAVRNARVARGRLEPSVLQQHLQLPGQHPGDVQVAPADLLTGCDGVPGVVLCWDGHQELVERLLILLRTGQLKARHVSANTLACLAAVRKEDGLTVLDGLAAMLRKRDYNPMGALLECMKRMGLEW